MALEQGSHHNLNLVGRIIAGDIHVIQRAGATAEGPLYDAEHRDGRPLVLLLLSRPANGAEPPAARRFRLATRIRHPNVASVYALGELEDRSLYVVLEQLTGEPLLQILAARGALPKDEALELTFQVAEGLEAAHDVGFVHGNLSPSTVVVTRASPGRAQVKVVGFNTDPDRRLATRLQTSSVEYASPERLGGAAPDERSDVFSLGAVLHHLLTGAPPARSYVDPAVPEHIGPVLEKALAPVASERYRTMGEFRVALERAAAAAAGPGPAGRRGPAALRVMGVGVAIAAGMLLLVPMWTRFGAPSEPATPPPTTSTPPSSPAGPSRSVSGGSSAAAAPQGRSDQARPTGVTKAADRPAGNRRTAAEPRATGGSTTAGVEPSGGSRTGRSGTQEPLGYVAQTPGSSGSEDAVERPPARAAQQPKPTSPVVRAPPPRTRTELNRHQGLRLAMEDVTRIGLGEEIVEVRPGLLVVRLAPGGMGVPSADYNLQRLYLAYSAATRDQASVTVELRQKGEVYGWFTREGLRYPSSDLAPQ